MSDTPKRQFSIHHTVGCLGMILVILVAASAGGSLAMLIYLPGAVIVFGLTFFALLANFGHDLFEFIADAAMTLFSKPAAPVPRFAEIAKFGSRYAIGAGMIGMLLLILRMLRQMSGPTSIVVGLSPSVLTALYAVITSELFFAFLYKVYSDPDNAADSQPLPLRGTVLLLVVFLLVLTAIYIVIITFS